jgi:hypothetical protein
VLRFKPPRGGALGECCMSLSGCRAPRCSEAAGGLNDKSPGAVCQRLVAHLAKRLVLGLKCGKVDQSRVGRSRALKPIDL